MAPSTRVVLPALAAFCALACGANHNEEERRAYAEAQGFIDIDPSTCEPRWPDVPKPKRVDCDEPLAGYEFYPIIDIDQKTHVYVYGDKTASFGEVDIGWEPPSEVLSRCKGDDDEDNPQFVGHVRGGPFLYYGGGVGRSMSKMTESPELPFSPEFGKWARDASEWEGVSFWGRRSDHGQSGIRVAVGDKYTDEDLAYVDYYSRALDKDEDEIYPRADAPYCRRRKECDCPLGKPCSYYEGTREGDPDAGYYCWDPQVDLPPASPKPDSCDAIPPGSRFRQPSMGEAVVDYDRCGPTQCDRFYPAYEGEADFQPTEADGYCPPNTSCDDGLPLGVRTTSFDPEFYGRACTPFTHSNGLTARYCFDPGEDPAPPENDNWCTDIRYASVALTDEWQFFTVPFSEMQAYGYAKEVFDLDLETIATVKFTWDRGYIDFWFDDVSFYRRVDR